MRRALSGLVLVALLLCAAGATASDLQAFVEEQMAAHRVAGAQVALVQDGVLTESFAVGFSNASTRKPLATDSVLQAGSVSKPVATWVLMTLVRDGRVDLDAPVADYLSDWQLKSNGFDAGDVTLRRILSHTAGLSLSGYPGILESEPLPGTIESLNGASGGAGAVEIVMPPGTRFAYSGGGYTLMQHVVETVTGESFEQYAQHAVLQPLGMFASSYEPGTALLARRATPHGVSFDPLPQHHFRAQAAASLHATAEDLARFMIANLAAGNSDTEPATARLASPSPLRADLIRLMHKPIARARARGERIGLGFFILGDGNIVGHGGSNQGWKAELQFAPADKTGIAILTNSESGGVFTGKVICYWDTHFSAGYLAERCARAEQVAQQTRQSHFIATLVLVGLATLVSSISVIGLVMGRVRFSLPGNAPRIIWLASCGLLFASWAALLYTPLGVWLFAGFMTSLDTIDYLPPSFLPVSVATLLLLATLVVPGLLVRRDASPD